MPTYSCEACSKPVAVADGNDEATCPFCLRTFILNAEMAEQEFVDFVYRRSRGNIGCGLLAFHVLFALSFIVGAAASKNWNRAFFYICVSGAIFCTIFACVTVGLMMAKKR